MHDYPLIRHSEFLTLTQNIFSSSLDITQPDTLILLLCKTPGYNSIFFFNLTDIKENKCNEKWFIGNDIYKFTYMGVVFQYNT